MTDHNVWDDTQNAVTDALSETLALFGQVPDTMHHAATRSRILMTMDSLDAAQKHLKEARDFLAAARARLPKD